jgi:HSP20 family molecular chaperone IbpA
MAKQDTSVQKQEAKNLDSSERTRSGKVFIPPVDIIESDDALTLMADMPGVDERNLEITLDNDILSIQANVEPALFDGYDLVYQEYEVGDYQRSFTLSETINREKIEATYKNGVLQLHLPKAEPAKPKKISIKTS